MKFLERIKNKIETANKVVEVRFYDYALINDFFENNKCILDYLYLTMLNDDDIARPLIENGVVVDVPIATLELEHKTLFKMMVADGVKETIIDYPCITYRFKNGRECKMMAYKTYEYYPNKKKVSYCTSGMGVPDPRRVFEKVY